MVQRPDGTSPLHATLRSSPLRTPRRHMRRSPHPRSILSGGFIYVIILAFVENGGLMDEVPPILTFVIFMVFLFVAIVNIASEHRGNYTAGSISGPTINENIRQAQSPSITTPSPKLHTTQDIEIGKLEINSEFKCPICGSLVTKDSEVVRCTSCRMPTHKDCFEFNSRCGVYACGGTAENKQEGTAIYCPGCQHANFRIDDRTPFQCEGCGGWHLRNG